MELAMVLILHYHDNERQLAPKREGDAMSSYPEILTLEQAAGFLQVSARTIQRLVADGRLPGRQVGSQWRFDREQLRDWVRGEGPASADRRKDEDARRLRDLVEAESRRLGVDVPETLQDLQRDFAARRGRGSAGDADPD